MTEWLGTPLTVLWPWSTIRLDVARGINCPRNTGITLRESSVQLITSMDDFGGSTDTGSSLRFHWIMYDISEHIGNCDNNKFGYINKEVWFTENIQLSTNNRLCGLCKHICMYYFTVTLPAPHLVLILICIYIGPNVMMLALMVWCKYLYNFLCVSFRINYI